LGNRQLDVLTLRQLDNGSGKTLRVEIEPGRDAPRPGRFHRSLDLFIDPALLLDGDDLALGHPIRRDRDLFAVDQEMAVADELPRLRARCREAERVDDVVETSLELLEQVRAGNSLPPLRPRERQAKLALEQAVHALDLLLFAQLDSVAQELRASAPVLARRIVAPLDRALILETAVPFQEQLHPFAPAEPANRFGVTRQRDNLLDPSFGFRPSSRPGWIRRFTDEVVGGRSKVIGLTPTSYDLCPISYTLLRFLGRQPLCGIGVVSLIDLMSSPLACSARIADSRPAPGPVTRTSTDRTPCSFAPSAQLAAASCAAKGVPLREPLKPIRPAEDQARTPPSWSAIAMIVLLKEACTVATACGTFFFSFFAVRARLPLGFTPFSGVAAAVVASAIFLPRALGSQFSVLSFRFSEPRTDHWQLPHFLVAFFL